MGGGGLVETSVEEDEGFLLTGRRIRYPRKLVGTSEWEEASGSYIRRLCFLRRALLPECLFA